MACQGFSFHDSQWCISMQTVLRLQKSYLLRNGVEAEEIESKTEMDYIQETIERNIEAAKNGE